MNKTSLGKLGEQAACDFLRSINYTIVEQNFRCRLGEIDIIAQDKNVLVFVEVKTRVSISCGQPFESVTPVKKRRLVNLALTYLKYKYRTTSVLSRFDVVSIVFQNGTKNIRHIKSAFDRD